MTDTRDDYNEQVTQMVHVHNSVQTGISYKFLASTWIYPNKSLTKAFLFTFPIALRGMLGTTFMPCGIL